MALDPDSRLVLSVVVGKRVGETAVMLLEDVKRRLGGRTPELITSDEWSAYPEAIREVFGREVTPEPTGKPGRPAGPRKEVPAGLTYATVHKTRENGRVVEVATRLVMGLWAVLTALLGGSKVNTSYIERQNATDRHQNARKGRKTYRREQGLGDARGDDGLHDVQLQLLLAGQDVADKRAGREVARANACHGRRLDGSHLVVEGMAYFSCLSTLMRHHPESSAICRYEKCLSRIVKWREADYHRGRSGTRAAPSAKKRRLASLGH